MKYRLKKYSNRLTGIITLESSKSESNRALMINALSGNKGTLLHLSNARDSKTMKVLLESLNNEWDVKDAGTTMRFLTAFLSVVGSGQTITGTDRMKKRPIWPLVDALRELGATIEYLEKDGFPPLKIHKLTTQKTDCIKIPGNISSQYISALMMIGPCLPKGLSIELTTEIFSKPYIELTQSIMQEFGVESKFDGSKIKIPSKKYVATTYSIEGDWSGASYWYSFMALSYKKSSISLPRLKLHSSQGDRAIAEIMRRFGVSSRFESGEVRLQKTETKEESLHIDFKNCPDLAQTIMAVAAVSGITLNMTGLESLRIKETDRIQAMKIELSKLGAVLRESTKKWILKPSDQLPQVVEIDTYEDHRMAMAFAPLCQLMDVTINEPNVVNKSYPGFWDEVKKRGIKINEVL
ncbi:MAG: 3-phosphoshikimate 1-carboxyvinyltransferase [Bacteroidota bacterium]